MPIQFITAGRHTWAYDPACCPASHEVFVGPTRDGKSVFGPGIPVPAQTAAPSPTPEDKAHLFQEAHATPHPAGPVRAGRP